MAGCYLITVIDGFQKIGRTNNLKKRLAALQTGSFKSLYVKSSIDSNRPDVLESILHHQYDSYRRIGEWFELPKSELAKWYPRGYVDFDDHKDIINISGWMREVIYDQEN